MRKAHHYIKAFTDELQKAKMKQFEYFGNSQNRDICTKCQDCQEDEPLNLYEDSGKASTGY